MDKQIVKKYSKIAITLGCIAGGSALLIGIADMITRDIIYENQNAEKLASIKEIYGENAKYSKENVINNKDYTYLESYFEAKDTNDILLGNVFITSGVNDYGEIVMAVGIDSDESVGRISLITNGQSFGQKLQDDYIDKYNNGDISLDDTSCGATYGANLVKNMALEAQRYYRTEMLGQKDDVSQYLPNIFGENVNYGEETAISNDDYNYLRSYWMVNDAQGEFVGSVFYTMNKTDYGATAMLVGINNEDDISQIYLTINENSYGDKLQSDYVDKFNKGEITIDDVQCGATNSASLVRDMAKQAQKYYLDNLKPTDINDLLFNIFGENVDYGTENKIADETYPYLLSYWNVKDNNQSDIGSVFYTLSKTEYATTAMLVGIDTNENITRIYLTINENSYGDKLQSDYVDKFNKGEITIDDVQCGATNSASLVRDMAKQAQKYYVELIKGGK